MRVRSWPFWILIIVIASGPWFGIVRQPQWDRVTWIPFRGEEDKPKDVLVNFLLLAFIIFMMIQQINRLRRAHAEPAAAAPAAPPEDIVLLHEIRDSLRR